MSKRQTYWTIGLLALTAESLATATMIGPSAMVEAVVSQPIARVFAVELVACLGMLAFAMWRDAAANGRNALPYIALTALLGPIGPLAYWAYREDHPAEAKAPERRTATQPA